MAVTEAHKITSSNDSVPQQNLDVAPASSLQHEANRSFQDGANPTPLVHGARAALVPGVPNARVDGDGSLKIQGSNLPAANGILGSAEHQAVLFGEGVITGSLLNPMNAVGQLTNHIFGTHLGKLDGFSNQNEVDSSNAGRMGEIGGTAVDFIGLTIATGGVADAIGLVGTSAIAFSAAGAGAIEGGLLMPSRDDNFSTGRLENAALGAVAGVATVVGGAAIGALGDGISVPVLSGAVKLAGGAAFGAALGAATTEVGSLIDTGKSASVAQLAVGAGLGLGGGLLGARAVLSAEPDIDLYGLAKNGKVAPGVGAEAAYSGRGGDRAITGKDANQPAAEERRYSYVVAVVLPAKEALVGSGPRSTNVLRSPGHVASYVTNEKGYITKMYSMGPLDPVTNLKGHWDFISIRAPARNMFPVKDESGTVLNFRFRISEAEYKTAIGEMDDGPFPGNYTLEKNCVVKPVRIGQMIGLDLPNGSSPVRFGRYSPSINAPNPWGLAQQLVKLGQMPEIGDQRDLSQAISRQKWGRKY